MYKKQMQYPDLKTGFQITRNEKAKNTDHGIVFDYTITSLEFNAVGDYIKNVYKAKVLLDITDHVPTFEVLSVSYPKTNEKENPEQYLRMTNGEALYYLQCYFGAKEWEKANRIIKQKERELLCQHPISQFQM